MNKRAVVTEIQSYLTEELAALAPGLSAPSSDSTREQASLRAREIQSQLAMYKFLPLREYGPEDVVCPGTLAELELNGRRAFYLLVPSGGGLVMRVDGQPVQVVTPQSPLGDQLLGKKTGDSVRLGEREYRVVSVR